MQEIKFLVRKEKGFVVGYILINEIFICFKENNVENLKNSIISIYINSLLEII